MPGGGPARLQHHCNGHPTSQQRRLLVQMLFNACLSSAACFATLSFKPRERGSALAAY